MSNGRLLKLFIGLATAIGATLAAFTYAGYVDWPTQEDETPFALKHALGAKTSEIKSFNEYEMFGGFIDREYLWRIEAEAPTVAQIVAGLELKPTGTMPEPFWRMAPHYWPRSMPPDAEAYTSVNFIADRRGEDGEHFFLVHDKANRRAYVWFKRNF